jgi:hypothetical protein
VLTETNASFAAVPAPTVRAAVALVSPGADTVIAAPPSVVGVKLDVAMPPLEVTGDVGLNEPLTPLTANVIGVGTVVTVLPLAS